MTKDNFLQEFDTLPPGAQKQVLDFIAFLQTRYSSISGKIPAKPKSKLAEEPFIGIWRNREDMHDSSAWVRKIRAAEWGN
jgi:hypothetical protein